MNRILFICQTYPDSRATIILTQKIAEQLAIKGHKILVFPIKRDKRAVSSTLVNNVEIVVPEEETKYGGFCFRLLFWKVLRYVTAFFLKIFKNKKWLHLFDWKLSEKIYVYSNAAIARNLIDKRQIQTVISVSAFFLSHQITDKAKQLCKTKFNWIAMNFDPYAYSQTEGKKGREREEKKVYHNCDHIMMLEESRNDYVLHRNSWDITYFHLPIIWNSCEHNVFQSVTMSSSVVNCVCLGRLYLDIRNPEFLLQLFSKFQQKNIRLYLIGGCSGQFPTDYMEKWKKTLGEKLICVDRVSQEEADAIMNTADVLINIGNTTTNQCPSKVLSYIGKGKPILNISKVEKCTSKAVLQSYPLLFSINEYDILTKETVDQAEQFVLNSKGKKVSRREIEDLYPNYNLNAIAQKIEAFLN